MESWRHNEDVVLCLFWITVSGDHDGVTGKDQVKELWGHIEKEYEANKLPGCQTRLASSFESRWQKISWIYEMTPSS